MDEISLNILDIVQNSIKAKASSISISIDIDRRKDLLSIIIKDNGEGMSKDQLEKVEDPFYTTRTTRKVGLGIPFFKYAAISTGGNFAISSNLGEGTVVRAEFIFSHIDRMPLGNIVETMHLLITMHQNIHFLYTYKLDNDIFSLDTKDLKEILGDIPFNVPEVSNFIKEFLLESHNEINRGSYI
ncbi:MAG: sensor histidine kinase [Clostridiales bacterium]|nr:sensor histidine kinase [Clostridiales bacterium]